MVPLLTPLFFGWTISLKRKNSGSISISMIYCGSGSDFGKFSVSVPVADNI
jgi:hypothetical protein